MYNAVQYTNKFLNYGESNKLSKMLSNYQVTAEEQRIPEFIHTKYLFREKSIYVLIVNKSETNIV